jgi:hydrogenase maturation protein HypF
MGGPWSLHAGVACQHLLADHNLEIVYRVNDSVVRFTNGVATFLRLSRAYVPAWIKMPRRLG